jgi:DNA polymerase-3 subunit gamma/tau
MQLCSITNGGLGTTVEKKNDGFKVAANIKPGSRIVEYIDSQKERAEIATSDPKNTETPAPTPSTASQSEKSESEAQRRPPTIAPPLQSRVTATGKRRIPSVSASLGNMLNDKPKAEAAKEAEDSKENGIVLSEEYSDEDLMKAWSELMTQFETEGKEGSSLVTSAMRERTPIREGNHLKMLVENKSQEEEVLVFRPDMHDILRTKLKNSLITIEVTINRDMTERKAYTDAEKFQKMIDRNPSLLTLKQKLDLDFI